MDQLPASKDMVALNPLISIARDGLNGLSRAVEDAQDPQLKATLRELLQERELIVEELTAVVTQLGGDPVEGGTLTGTAHRSFMELKRVLANAGDQALIEECIRGDNHAAAAFQEALNELRPTVPEAARPVVQCSLERIRVALERYEQLAHFGAGIG